METHNHAEDSSQNSLSDFDIWGRLIKYRTEIQWRDITSQVKKLEVEFDHGWKRFIDKPCVDQYGQVWMIWENSSANPSCPKERYQIYTIPDDSDKFDYVFIDDIEVTPTLGEPIYKFSVGFDNFGDAEVLNIQMSDERTGHCLLSNNERDRWETYRRWTKHDNNSYSAMEDLRRSYERYEKMQRKLGNYSFSAAKRFGEIYDKYGRIQRKLGDVSIRDLAIAA